MMGCQNQESASGADIRELFPVSSDPAKAGHSRLSITFLHYVLLHLALILSAMNLDPVCRLPEI